MQTATNIQPGQIPQGAFMADLKRNQRKAKTTTAKDVLTQLLATIEPVDFDSELGLEPGDRMLQKHIVVLIVEKVLEAAKAKHWGLCRRYDFIYCYTGTHWQEIDKDQLKTFLGQAAERMGYSILESKYHKFREELYKQFICAAVLAAPEPDPDSVFINLENGTLKINGNNRKLHPHDPADFMRYVLPFEYDPSSTSPLFDGYLKRVLPDQEAREVLAEYVGYIFTRGLKLEKMLLLYGSGANGKSVFFDVMNALLGRDNISNYSLANLSEEHNRALIANKLLNYGSEIRAGINSDLFKALASGEPIQARLKYGNSFLMEAYAKLAFNCNELPKDVEHNEAYFRRFLIIHFDVTIPESERNPDLAAQIIAKELPGVLKWVLEGLNRLLTNRRFTDCVKIRESLERYRLESDSAWSFLDDAGYEISTTNQVALKEMYSAYKAYCLENGFIAGSIRKFGDRLRNHGYTIEKRNFGKVVYCTKK